ncbi:DOR domain containing protein [Asbolus verrucosus]|uniref:DOR domain containing protein n=1 Tax=Asbolus verrucosus TaxID=1661398 RepID=A0A482W648_ASBVE|nr:DOR domain containing protein [Asbolus verrucosus]
MFHQLSKYVLEQWWSTELPQRTSSAAAEGVETSRLTSAETEDDWVLVDRRDDSEGNSKSSSMESINIDDDDDVLVVEESPDRVVVVNRTNHPVPALLNRTNSTSSLPRASTMEESWFLTPPPCFISTGPVHMETSPLENLLIEHPSMSVYTHHGRRHNFLARSPTPDPEDHDEVAEEEGDDDDGGVVLVHREPRINRVHVLQQQERQGLNGRQAQKVGE